jgi:hypothetical protein
MHVSNSGVYWRCRYADNENRPLLVQGVGSIQTHTLLAYALGGGSGASSATRGGVCFSAATPSNIDFGMLHSPSPTPFVHLKPVRELEDDEQARQLTLMSGQVLPPRSLDGADDMVRHSVHSLSVCPIAA